MIEQLKDIIFNSKDNKHSYNVKKNDKVYQWVLNQTSHFPEDSKLIERIYTSLTGIDIICQYGKKKKFLKSSSLKNGYSACSHSCQCYKENHSQKLNSAWNNRTRDNIIGSNIKRKKTCLEKYGTEFNSQSEVVKNKKRNTCRIKLGVDTNLLHIDTQNKIKDTLIKKYGVDNPSKSKTIRKKTESTNLMKYGNICNLQNTNIRKRISDQHLQKYGVEWFHGARYTQEQKTLLIDRDLLQSKLLNKTISQVAREYNLQPGVISDRIINWNLKYDRRFTEPELQIKNFLDSLKIDYVSNTRKIISPLELDFFMPDNNLGIEVCGLYWHSERSGKKDKYYHVNKLQQCQLKGIKLLTIFTDEFENWKKLEDLISVKLLEEFYIKEITEPNCWYTLDYKTRTKIKPKSGIFYDKIWDCGSDN